MSQNGYTTERLSKESGVSATTIGSILMGRYHTWGEPAKKLHLFTGGEVDQYEMSDKRYFLLIRDGEVIHVDEKKATINWLKQPGDKIHIYRSTVGMIGESR